ncbi:MAG TPA: LLM class flavin-dependent oxidoreductase [Ktedonobacteraceae bacterium]|nr:LLM class flavin-dependent oxidoreductase [Ktedonobacteraceae bacterium]
MHLNQTTSKQSMKIGVMLSMVEGSFEGRTPTFQDLQTMAQAAEQSGLDSLWLADHLIYRFPELEEFALWETFTMLSALAAVTTRVEIGTMVACTSFRPPALLAKMADTIDEISSGRFTLGLGAGWHQPEYEAFGYPFDHLASRFEEALQIIVPLLREGHVDFQGKYYQVNNCVLRPRGPSKGGPPILIGAKQPRMLQLVARYADAWNTAWHTDPAVAQQRYAPLQAACEEVGRDPATITLTAGILVRLQPGEDGKEERAITGSPEEIARRLHDFVGIGVAHLIVNLEPLTVATIEQLAHIVELVRAM